MTEHRTRPIDRSLLFTELAAVCESLEKAGVREALVSFGWDSHLSIDKMWKDQTVSVQEIMSFVTSSEASGIATVGKSDIFVDTPGLKLTLCHDGDAHIKGDSPIVGQFVHRWGTLGYEPYEVQPRV